MAGIIRVGLRGRAGFMPVVLSQGRVPKPGHIAIAGQVHKLIDERLHSLVVENTKLKQEVVEAHKKAYKGEMHSLFYGAAAATFLCLVGRSSPRPPSPRSVDILRIGVF